MKKKYLLFILCLLMFFCVNIDGVKAATKECNYKGNIKRESTEKNGSKKTNDSIITAAVYIRYSCTSDSCGETTYKFYVHENESVNSEEFVEKTFRNWQDIYRGKKLVNGEINCPTSIYIEPHWASATGYWYSFSYDGGSNFEQLKLQDYTGDEAAKNDAVTGVKSNKDSSTTYEDDDEIYDNAVDAITKWGTEEKTSKYEEVDPTDACNIINSDIKDLINQIFTIISVVGIIAVVGLTIFNLVGVIAGSEDDGLPKFFKKLKVRIICLVILLLLPTLVSFIVQVVNGAGNLWGVKSDNPVCNINASFSNEVQE